MFDQFDTANGATGAKASRRRMGASLAVSIVVYGALATIAVAISATVGTAVRREELRQVVFAPPPSSPRRPEPPALPPPPAPRKVVRTTKRALVQRNALAAPDAIPDVVPAEADGPLVDAEPAGPVDGFLDGGSAAPSPPRAALDSRPVVKKASPRPVVHRVERVSAPQPMESNPSPAYPEEARRNGVQGTVVARIVVETGGRVGQVEILSGPEELHDTVLRTLRRWRFRPATLEGRPVSVQRIVRIPFRLETVGRG